nr:hypothetical protein [Tanacetum cinerariifolium]
MVAASKVPMLKPENGATLPKTQVVEGVTPVMPITSVEEKVQRRLDVKARITLMMCISNEHPLKFNSIKDAKQLLEAIEKRFGFKSCQPNSPQLAHEDLEQIPPNDMEEMDLRWQMAMFIMREKRFLKKTVKKKTVNGNETLGFDLSTVECYNCHKRGHFPRECRAPRNKDNKYKESTRRSVPVETPASTTLVSCDSLVPPPYIGNFMHPTPDLSYTGLDKFAVKPEVKNKSSEKETKAVRKNIDALLIEEWVSNDEVENATQPKIVKKTVRPSIVKKEFVKHRQQEKIARKTVKKVKHNRQNTHRPRGNQRN